LKTVFYRLKSNGSIAENFMVASLTTIKKSAIVIFLFTNGGGAGIFLN
jgi:hypothetical protein